MAKSGFSSFIVLVKTPSVESTERHWKINGMMDDVKCMQNDYVDLKKRVEILKVSSSSPGDDSGVCEAHAENTTMTYKIVLMEQKVV